MVRNIRTRICTIGLLVVGFPALAIGGMRGSYPELARVLRPGDVVDVTDWTGAKRHGTIDQVTPCSVILITNEQRMEIPASQTKTVKRLRRADPGAAAHRIADAGRKCDQPGCMAVTLAFAGTTAVARSMRRLFSRPETIYRARDRQTSTHLCTTPSAAAAIRPR